MNEGEPYSGWFYMALMALVVALVVWGAIGLALAVFG
jgi:hypothetical protein